MRTFILPALLALSTAACGTDDPCANIRSVDDALASACNVTNDTPPSTVACTPRAGTICTVLGTGEAGVGGENVPGVESRAYHPLDVTMGPDGRVAYFIDWNNHTIRALSPDGRVRTVVGTGELQDGEDPPVPLGAPRVATPSLRHRLNHPTHMFFDTQGRMLIAAWHNSMVKRVTMIGQPNSMIEDFCGTGARSFGGDSGPALNAALNLPVAMVVNSQGEVIIADQANQRIRKVSGEGVITTMAGDGMRGYAGDNGPATMARLNNPVGQAAPPAGRIDIDATGNLYVADTGNNVIRKIDTRGMITTFAGTGMAGATGDGGPATMAMLNAPTDIDVAPDGTVYIADTANSCVRAVGSDGMIRTVAGRCGQRGFRGDGAAPTTALLDRPYGIEVDTMGRIWIADTYNQRIRVIMTR